jgi:hypothetical protein
MRKDKIVQFVCFETKIDTEKFVMEWEQYTRSVNSNEDVTLQQSERNGVFRYIAQHRSETGEFQFIFTKARRSSRTPEVEIRAKQAGGYSILQIERMDDACRDESKIFVFLNDQQADLGPYRQLSSHGKLNIYEAYYENCRYAYILEFFVKNKYIPELLEELKQNNPSEIGIYKECMLQAS